MVKKSLNTIKELNQSDLDLEIKDYEKEIKKLNYEFISLGSSLAPVVP